MNKIRTGVPGMYRVTPSEFETYADFDQARREAEAIATRRMAYWKTQRGAHPDYPFDLFVIEIVAPPHRS